MKGTQSERIERKKKVKKIIILTAILLSIITVVCLIYAHRAWTYNKTHFSDGTIISGVDCSHLTVDEAKNKIEEQLNQEISFKVITISDSGNSQIKEYFMNDEEIESLALKVDSNAIANIKEKQWASKGKDTEFGIEGNIQFKEEYIIEYLKTIKELQNSNIVIPQNAYLRLGVDNRVEIVPEVVGNKIDFDEACKLAIQKLREGESQIDFTTITQRSADITQENSELKKQQEEINNVLRLEITFELTDGTIVTLNDSIIKDWLEIDENEAIHGINIEDNLPKFIESLAERAWKANSYMSLEATEIGTKQIYVREGIRAGVDKEKETELVKSMIQNAQSQEAEIIYDKELISDNLETYIELDITRQTVWMYKDKELILETPCVTGNINKGNGTPTGIYYLSYKTKDAVLRGYKPDGSLDYASPVKYWMPFNGGIGFHDASWQSSFGGKRYLTHGSHGCVNLPLESAKILYENINTEIPIIVYES